MIKIFLTIFVVFFMACAPGPRPKHPRPGKPDARNPPVTDQAEVETAERKASNALVDDGRAALDHGLYDRASDFFQQAVTVDPTNGVGYYYLALVKLRSGEYGGVWGFLEKAESLLSKDPEWSAKTEELRKELMAQKPD